MNSIESTLQQLIVAATERIGLAWSGSVPVERSKRLEFGDYATPIAFALAKGAGAPPIRIATDLARELSSAGDVIASAEATASGFVNLRLSREFLGAFVADVHGKRGAIADSDLGAATKVVIEHTNINPNKAAHIGHFRNACIGDATARILSRLGYRVEVHNYIDDTGVQVADVAVGLRRSGVAEPTQEPFDRYCSELYVEVQRAYEADPSLLEQRAEMQAAIESGEGELAEFAAGVARRIAAANLATMARAGIAYDLLTWESDILGYGFWQHAFDLLQSSGAIRLESEGPNAGCWVVPFGLGTVHTEDKTVTEDKVLVTSRGTITYTAKDIAYQMWKFGVLPKDFRYAPWTGSGLARDPDMGLWTSTRDDGHSDAPDFAGADMVINVIDARQAYPQQVVYECLRRMGFAEQADASHHLAYAVVNLSPAAAAEMGVSGGASASASAGEGDGAVAMSGRAGIQVWADELLDRLIARVSERTTDPEVAAAVAVGAARYYMLKMSNNQSITFDFEEALRTTGETGVYLQYAYVRASGIVRRLAGVDREARATAAPIEVPMRDRELLLTMSEYPRWLRQAADERSAQPLAKYGFDLATAFNAFYDNTTPVIQETDGELAAWRGGLVAACRLLLGDVLQLLGIEALERI